MLDAFMYLLCSKLCQHNRRVPTGIDTIVSMLLVGIYVYTVKRSEIYSNDRGIL